MSSHAVVTKFSDRLKSLTDNASRESIQTLSKYVAFNRKKHGPALVTVLSRAITNDAPSPKRKLLYLNVAHEVLVSESSVMADGGNEKKWERLAELRSVIGENLVVGAAESIRDAVAAAGGSSGASEDSVGRVRTMVDVWEEIGAFGGPTIVDSVRKALAAPPRTAATDGGDGAAAASAGEEPSKAIVPETKAVPDSPATPSTAAEDKTDKKSATEVGADKSAKAIATAAAAAAGPESGAATTTTKSASSTPDRGSGSPSKGDNVQQSQDDAAASSSGDDKEADDQESTTKDGGEGGGAAAQGAAAEQAKAYDFEAQGVPYEKVEPRDLLNPCKSIATMQIARELRNDTAVQLSSVVSMMPPEVEEACQKALDKAGDGDADGAKKKIDLDSIPPIPDDILDLDLDESLSNVRLYRDIIVKQREARKALIELLIKSRCRFGSDEAAEAFYSMASKAEQVKRRRVLLSDAMELEGLDFVEDEAEQDGDRADDGDEDNLEPLGWYDDAAAAGKGDAEQEPDAKKAKVAKSN